MTESATPEERRSVVVLDALPDGGLSMAQVDALADGDVIDLVGPLVIDKSTDRVTHLDVIIDDTHYYLGWHPKEEQWEQLLVVVDEDETAVLEAAISVVDEETGEPELGDLDANPDVADIVAFVWAYVEYTYPETERLYNVMDDALEDLSTNALR